MFKKKYTVPFIYAILLPVSFIAGIMMPRLKQILALFPRDPAYITGCISTVFVHKNLDHFSSNCLPLFVCLFGLFYFYQEIALRVTLISHVFTGFLIWIFARPAYHIGASGLVYALVFFILISGFIRANRRLLVFALAILVFQSGLIWGIFPMDNEVSWESHLLGAVTGTFLAFLFRREGPKPDRQKVWEEDDDEDDEDEYIQINQ